MFEGDLGKIKNLYKKYEKELRSDQKKELLKIYNDILGKITEKLYTEPIQSFKYILPQTNLPLDMIISKLTAEGFKTNINIERHKQGERFIIVSGWEKLD